MIQYLAHVRYDKLVVWLELLCIAIVLGTYMYFITRSVFEAVFHTSISYSIEQTEIKISQLERSYFEHLNSLTPDTLTDYDLVAVVPDAYLSLENVDAKLTRRD